METPEKDDEAPQAPQTESEHMEEQRPSDHGLVSDEPPADTDASED